MKLILASASPRRRELIKALSLDVEVIPSDVDEKVSADSAEALVTELARIKARSVFEKTGELTLGADTVVEVDGEILGKPRTAAEAEEMFGKLCGRTHRVLTGFCLIWQGGEVVDREITHVTFKEYDKKIVGSYIASGAPFDKAGGYGIQDGALAPLIASVNGDLDNVIGLPVQRIGKILKEKFGKWT